jgi:hypothetical protein
LDILEGAEKWWDSSACIQEKLDTGALELAGHPRFSFLIKLLSVTVLLLSRMMNVNILWENYLVFFSHFICKPKVSTAEVFLF